MALLSLDVIVRLRSRHEEGGDYGSPVTQEKLRAIEFVVRNMKSTAPWPPPAASDGKPLAMPSEEAYGALAPSVFYYAPLGGRFSKEFREALRRGITRLLTELVLRQLVNMRQEKITGARSSGNTSGIESFVSFRGGCHNREVAYVHWSPGLLSLLLSAVDTSELRFDASLPLGSTLVPFTREMKAPTVQQSTGTELLGSHGLHGSINYKSGGNDHVHKYENLVCQLHAEMQRMEVIQQSLHDERTADRLADFLYHFHLKPAEQMREAGGDALKLQRYRDALDCYCKALSTVQKGLLVPYRHALRPPPSLEDRVEGTMEEDILDEATAFALVASSPSAKRERTFLAPANRYFNTLLQLDILEATDGEGKEICGMRSDSLLFGCRAVLPRARPLFHVWYMLHRHAVVAVANAAHTLLLLQAAQTPSFNSVMPESETCVTELSSKELRHRQARAGRWCGRALGMLQCINVWLGDCFKNPAAEGAAPTREWIWVQSMRFKILLRRARLMQLVGTFEEWNRAVEATDEQLRVLQAQSDLSCCASEVQGILDDVRERLEQERSLLQRNHDRGSGLVLRL
ncbi:uncharacterized protein TEOVI_000076400 [Trypanosoma equiperdum]|uniref:Uncharacterized protein n=1 Tax=Trypanosoma equiperdum TaxID=5694 RepID=A0A1G4IBB2_TRYEQ|nr:hypothetical protein, conserved [Trypanosoma equiperdum]